MMAVLPRDASAPNTSRYTYPNVPLENTNAWNVPMGVLLPENMTFVHCMTNTPWSLSWAVMTESGTRSFGWADSRAARSGSRVVNLKSTRFETVAWLLTVAC